MSYIDRQNTFDPANSALTATRVSTDFINTNALEGDIGIGGGTYLVAIVETALTSGGSSTLTFSIETDDNSSFSSAKVLYTSPAIAKASLIKGYVLYNQELMAGVEKYIRVKYTVGTADFTAGTVRAWLSGSQHNTQKIYPAKFNNPSA